MSMLKHVLTFFAFIMVSIAPVSADEGYIPFFPDFLEPDGIGIRADSEEEKDIFKTFGEISQKEIIIQAAMRQKYIDQGQSLNLMIPPDTKPKEVNELLIYAWQSGIKSLYYQRSANPAQELARNILNCASCQG